MPKTLRRAAIGSNQHSYFRHFFALVFPLHLRSPQMTQSITHGGPMNAPHPRRIISTVEPLEFRRLLAVPSMPDPGDFVSLIDNPYLPMIPGSRYVYRGHDGDEALKITIDVTHDTNLIQGVTTTVVREREYVDGELEEDTLDYFAQDDDGNVWYFGELSREVEDGKLVVADDSWQAGVDGAQAGIIMLARPEIGDRYQQEDAPGIAEDRARVSGLKDKMRVPFGTFGGLLRTRETNPLEAGAREDKFYARGIGFIGAQELGGGRDGEVIKLVSFTLPPSAFPDQLALDDPNRFFPLVPGTTRIYEGTSDGEDIEVRTAVTRDTRVVDGVTTLVVHDREFEAGDLIEDTFDYFAQDLLGNVWYFGEDSREIEDGEVISTEGSWLASVNGAERGIMMRAYPAVGDSLQTENAPGVAEDRAEVTALNQTVKTP